MLLWAWQQGVEFVGQILPISILNDNVYIVFCNKTDIIQYNGFTDTMLTWENSPQSAAGSWHLFWTVGIVGMTQSPYLAVPYSERFQTLKKKNKKTLIIIINK